MRRPNASGRTPAAPASPPTRQSLPLGPAKSAGADAGAAATTGQIAETVNSAAAAAAGAESSWVGQIFCGFTQFYAAAATYEMPLICPAIAGHWFNPTRWPAIIFHL